MKRLVILLCLALTLAGCTGGEHMTGTGTQADPYVIMTRADLEAINNDLTAYYELGANIDLAGENWTPIGTTEDPWIVNIFTGYLDGKEHKVSNMTIDTSGLSVANYIGLFCQIGDAALNSVQNVHICNAQITINGIDGDMIGLLAGVVQRADIDNCSASGRIIITNAVSSSPYPFIVEVGGLIGWAYGGSTIESCLADVKITLNTQLCDLCDIGGLIGNMGDGVITDCISNFVLNGTYGPMTDHKEQIQLYDVGGLVGYFNPDSQASHSLVASRCRVHCEIDLTVGYVGNGALRDFGGVMGFTWYGVDVQDCHVTGHINLSGPTDAAHGGYVFKLGGFYGCLFGHSTPIHSIEDNIQRCSSFVDIDIAGGNATDIGGFIGISFVGDISLIDCYSMGDVTIHDTGPRPVEGILFNDKIGGFAGSAYYLQNCYSAGKVEISNAGEHIGGLVGALGSGNISLDESNYWDTESSGQAVSAMGTGKTTAQMQTQSTFTDWDFTTVWNIASGTYPFLRTAFVSVADGCAAIVHSFPWVGRFQLSHVTA